MNESWWDLQKSILWSVTFIEQHAVTDTLAALVYDIDATAEVLRRGSLKKKKKYAGEVGTYLIDISQNLRVHKIQFVNDSDYNAQLTLLFQKTQYFWFKFLKFNRFTIIHAKRRQKLSQNQSELSKLPNQFANHLKQVRLYQFSDIR